MHADNGSTPFAGDGPLLTTFSPNGDGFRDKVDVTFRLREQAKVTMDVTRTVKVPKPFYTLTAKFGRGVHTMSWIPGTNLNPRTYLIRFTAVDQTGNKGTYGAPNAFVGRYARGVVARLQGIDAGVREAELPAGRVGPDPRRDRRALTDLSRLPLRSGAGGHLRGQSVRRHRHRRRARRLDWSRWQSKPHTISFRIPTVASGLYYVQFGGADGRVGYAPFVVRPTTLGLTSRVLVVLPTNTWQAYNFQDVNGDGYGDTWYAGPPNRTVDLSRSYIARGVPPRFYRYDLPFLHWLYWSGKSAEFISDSDFDQIASGDDLAKAYDLVVFEGHEEYVMSHEYDVIAALPRSRRQPDVPLVQQLLLEGRQAGSGAAEDRDVARGRPAGGCADRCAVPRERRWPEAGAVQRAGLGVRPVAVGEHRADRRRDVRTVRRRLRDRDRPDDAGLTPGTLILAQIPDLLGPGLGPQMTYYETPTGAKVFAAGVLDFGGSATFWPMKKMLDNLWARLSLP